MELTKLATKPMAATIAATTATAISGSLASDPESDWYKSLDLPSWQPPGWVFPIVWTALYADIAVTSGKVIEGLNGSGQQQEAAAFGKALAANLILNQGWSWTFFKAHKLGPATVVAGLLAGSSIDLARRARRAGKGKAAALAPYAAWCTFATVLSAEIWRRNR